MTNRAPLTDGMRELWRAVLIRAHLDALGIVLRGEEPEFARESVRAWLGTEDFYTVCHLAGANPDETRRLMEAELA